jgi:hypothetical protein
VGGVGGWGVVGGVGVGVVVGVGGGGWGGGVLLISGLMSWPVILPHPGFPCCRNNGQPSNHWDGSVYNPNFSSVIFGG